MKGILGQFPHPHAVLNLSFLLQNRVILTKAKNKNTIKTIQ